MWTLKKNYSREEDMKCPYGEERKTQKNQSVKQQKHKE